MTTKVFVGNLAFQTTDQQLEDHFKQIGSIKNGVIITRGRRSLGYGFVEFESAPDAAKAVQQYNQTQFINRNIKVELVRDPPPPRVKGTNTNTDITPPPAGQMQGNEDQGDAGEGKRRANRRKGSRRQGGGDQGQQGGGPQTQGGGNNQALSSQPPTQHTYNNQQSQNDEEFASPQPRRVNNRNDNYDRRRRWNPRRNYNNNNYYNNNYDNTYNEGGNYETQPQQQPQQQPPPQPRVLSKTAVFVANLPFALRDEGLTEIFKDYKVKSAHVVMTRFKRSRGFGFVEFETEQDQQKAVLEKNNFPVKMKPDSPAIRNISVTVSHSAGAVMPQVQ